MGKHREQKFRARSAPGRHRNEDEDEQPEQQKNPNHIDSKALLAMSAENQIGTIRELYTKITIDPETSFKEIGNIFVFTKSENVRVATTAIRTLAQIFVNVAPLQAIDLKQLEERTQKTVTKDEYKVLKFQKNLVDQYERYLKMLKQLNSKLKVTNFSADEQLFKQFKKCILHCVIKCFNTLWNFNHFKLLNELAMKFIKHQQCKSTIRQFLSSKNIATLSIKAKIINSISLLIKNKHQSTLPDDLVKIVNATNIDTRYLTKDAQAIKFKKKKMTKRLYKQKQIQKKKENEKRFADRGTLQLKKKIKEQKIKDKIKVREQVNKQFAEGEATISNKELVRSNSAILQQIFYIYFKILVQKLSSKFLKDTLDGILSFAHLINIDLITSLITHLETSSQIMREVWKQNKNQKILEARLLLVFTSESILNGPLSIFNMDDLRVTTSFFKILRDILNFKVVMSKDIFRLIGITIEETLLKRRQLSQQIVGSFLRELSFLLLREQLPKNYLLEIIRLIASKYNKVAKMFQQDNQGYGLNSYNEHCEDPQCTNAINTQILSNLRSLVKTKTKKKIPKEISDNIERIARQNFKRVEGTLPLDQILDQDLTLLEYQNHS